MEIKYEYSRPELDVEILEVTSAFLENSIEPAPEDPVFTF